MKHLIAYPGYFDQRQSQCFVCDREYRYFDDELVAMEPCCGALACIECRENKIIAGEICQCGVTLTTDDISTASLLRERSERKPYAQYMMGIYMIDFQPYVENAVSISTNREEDEDDLIKRNDGADFIQRAAKNKYVPACRMLASFHQVGLFGMKKDIEKAISVLLGVKDAGDPLASFDLANYFLEKKDRYNHFKHLKLASELGHGEARGMLGRLYWGSKLKSKDEIGEFFLFAVANSEPKCRGQYFYHLASLSREEGNSKQYIYWLRRASEDGHSVASYELGAYSLVGVSGCARDHVLARLYLERAMDQEPEHKIAKDIFLRHFKNTSELSEEV